MQESAKWLGQVRSVSHDERSEAWEESANAEQLLAKLKRLQETMAQLEDCE